MVKTILFDLDGTLLPMEQENFIKAYFGTLAKKLMPLGFEPEKLYAGIWAGVKAAIMNTSDKTNEEVWWGTFTDCFGSLADGAREVLDEYYANDFKYVQSSCGYTPKAKETIEVLKARGYRLVLATNPVFPATATQQRIGWAGLEISDFELVTTYENSRRCKPNVEYYADILAKIGEKAENCLMVGNDVAEDMVASTLGMKVFLLTDYLINKKDVDISVYKKGSFEELMTYVAELENAE